MAARSDSLRMVSRPRLVLLVDLRGRPLRQPLGPGQDGRERVVQLVRDAGDRLPERGEFFGLQQLVIQVARLVLELLALADVAHQRVDADRPILRGRIGMRRDFNPDRRIVQASQPEEVVGDGALRCEAIDERGACVGIDEARRIEGTNLRVAGFGRVAEHHLEVGIGREGFCLSRPETARCRCLREPPRTALRRRRRGARTSYLPCGGGGVGVSLLGKRGR